MAAIRFKVGDRVRARTAGFVPAGTPGTILQALLSMPGTYYIHFDGYAQPKLIRARDLERAEDTPPPDRQSMPDVDEPTPAAQPTRSDCRSAVLYAASGRSPHSASSGEQYPNLCHL